jgi:thiol-disulfide isomerase/thioredoxin
MSFSSALLNQYQQQYYAISDRHHRHPSSSSLSSKTKKKKDKKKELYYSSYMRQRSGAFCCSSKSSSSSLCFVSEDEEIDDDSDDCGGENKYATTRRRTAVLGAAAAAAAAVITMTPFTENAEAAVTSFVPKTATRAKTSLQNVVELTPENFKEYVSGDAENPTPNVFVEFYAPWCPFCQKLEPIWNELPNELRKYGNETTIARMNVDKYTDYARAYGVSGFPTLMLFEAGKPVGAKTGLIDMQTALKYAGVSKAKLGFAAGPDKALDKVLTKDQVENARKELDIVRKEVSSGLAGESRDKALTALNVVDGVFVSQL